MAHVNDPSSSLMNIKLGNLPSFCPWGLLFSCCKEIRWNFFWCLFDCPS